MLIAAVVVPSLILADEVVDVASLGLPRALLMVEGEADIDGVITLPLRLLDRWF